MLSGMAIVFQQIIITLYTNRYCVPMDDQRPISGAEQAFFSLGTGKGTFYFLFLYKFLIV